MDELSLLLARYKLAGYLDGFIWDIIGGEIAVASYTGDRSDIVIRKMMYLRGNTFSRKCLNLLVIEDGVPNVAPYCLSGVDANKVVVAGTVKRLSRNMFDSAVIHDELVLKDGIEVIDVACFSGCKVRRIEIPSTVHSIYDGAFANCDVESLLIPDSVKSINEYALSTRSTIKELRLPARFKSKGNLCFNSGCLDRVSISADTDISQVRLICKRATIEVRGTLKDFLNYNKVEDMWYVSGVSPDFYEFEITSIVSGESAVVSYGRMTMASKRDELNIVGIRKMSVHNELSILLDRDVPVLNFKFTEE